jgi:hypothetical protein
VIGVLAVVRYDYALTKGGPADSTQTLVTFLYSFGIMRMRVGFGSAVGVVLFAELEWLFVAADFARQRSEVPVAAGDHGVSGGVQHRLAAGARVRHSDNIAGRYRVLCCAEARRFRANSGGGKGVEVRLDVLGCTASGSVNPGGLAQGHTFTDRQRGRYFARVFIRNEHTLTRIDLLMVSSLEIGLVVLVVLFASAMLAMTLGVGFPGITCPAKRELS